MNRSKKLRKLQGKNMEIYFFSIFFINFLRVFTISFLQFSIFITDFCIIAIDFMPIFVHAALRNLTYLKDIQNPAAYREMILPFKKLILCYYITGGCYSF